MTESLARPRERKVRFRRRAPRAPVWSFALTPAVAVLLALAIGLGGLAPGGGVRGAAALVPAAIAAELRDNAADPAEVAFYASRGDRPLWVQGAPPWAFWRRAGLHPAAGQLLKALAAEGGADPRLADAVREAASGRPMALARADVELSQALADHVRNLRRTPPGAQLEFTDPALAPTLDTRATLEAAARAPSLSQHLAAVEAINPVYQSLLAGLAAYRAEWSRLPQVQVPAGPVLRSGADGERVRLLRLRLGLPPAGGFDAALEQAVRRFQSVHALAPSGEADAATLQALNAGAQHYERLIAANLIRARALPPVAGRRFILVNPAAARLWVYEDGRARNAMRVVVGARDDPTPMIAGLVRYLVFNPYWEIPSDLVRDSLAPRLVREGLGHFETAHMEALSDWTDQAQPLDPRRIDWKAVAAGRVELHVRQRPGPDNMMGTVKFMLPNELGIYLHDTPNKAAFDRPERLLSAGCVRLERAGELAAWVLGRSAPDPATLGANRRFDLAEPVPVYITYLTAAPDPTGGVRFYPDVYARDPALLAR